MKYRKAYEWGKTRLEMAEIRDASIDARLLLEFVCHTNRNDLYAHSEEELSESFQEQYETLIKKRAIHIPLQHLTGTQEFMGLEFIVNEHVLVPRQDTECLVEEALIVVNDGDSVLDMCTGSGCILLSLMKYKNHLQGVGVDISEEAIAVAKANAMKLQNELQSKPSFVISNMFEKIEGIYDVILSNPPYIRTAEIDTLDEEVRLHDPFLALDGKTDGLFYYRILIREAQKHLRSEGYLLMEIGCDQKDAVSQMMMDNGFLDVAVVEDLSGLPRVVKGRR